MRLPDLLTCSTLQDSTIPVSTQISLWSSSNFFYSRCRKLPWTHCLLVRRSSITKSCGQQRWLNSNGMSSLIWLPTVQINRVCNTLSCWSTSWRWMNPLMKRAEIAYNFWKSKMTSILTDSTIVWTSERFNRRCFGISTRKKKEPWSLKIFLTTWTNFITLK